MSLVSDFRHHQQKNIILYVAISKEPSVRNKRIMTSLSPSVIPKQWSAPRRPIVVLSSALALCLVLKMGNASVSPLRMFENDLSQLMNLHHDPSDAGRFYQHLHQKGETSTMEESSSPLLRRRTPYSQNHSIRPQVFIPVPSVSSDDTSTIETGGNDSGNNSSTDANKMSFRIEPTQMLQRMRDGSTDKKPSPSPSVALNNYYAYEEPTHGERSYDTSIRKDRSRRPRRRRGATIGLGRFSYQEQEDRRTQRLVSSSSDEL